MQSGFDTRHWDAEALDLEITPKMFFLKSGKLTLREVPKIYRY